MVNDDDYRLDSLLKEFKIDVPMEESSGTGYTPLLWTVTPKEGLKNLIDGRFRSEVTVADRGWAPCDGKWDQSPETGSEKLRARLRRMNVSYRDGNIEALRAIVVAAQSVGAIPVVLVAPTSPAYRDAMPDAMRREFRNALQELATQYGVTIGDYLADTRFGNEDFCDPDHLSRLGAQRFSEIIRAEVLAPLADISTAPGAPATP
jgi:hypothetical protein